MFDAEDRQKVKMVRCNMKVDLAVLLIKLSDCVNARP